MINQTVSQGQDELFRVFRLKRWLQDRGITGVALAGRLGVSTARVSQILSRPTCPERHRKTLAELGVPSELLPQASRGKPGPRPGWVERRVEAACADAQGAVDSGWSA